MQTETKGRSAADRAAISRGMRESWARRREREAQLRSLDRVHRRVIERLFMLVPVVEEAAREPDGSLARHVLSELRKAEDALKAENIAAATIVHERQSLAGPRERPWGEPRPR